MRTPKLKYPSIIIPKIRFKLQIDIDSLTTSVDSLFIVRRIDAKSQRNRMGNLHPMGLYTNDVPDMSMNLLGAKFISKHAELQQKGPAAHDWTGELVKVQYFGSYCQVAENYRLVFIPVAKVHGIPIPYTAPYNKEFVKSNRKFSFERAVQNGPIKAVGIVKTLHKPTMLNYWHVTLEVKASLEDDPITQARNQVHTSLCDTIIENVISKFATDTLPSGLPKINRSHYLKIAV